MLSSGGRPRGTPRCRQCGRRWRLVVSEGLCRLCAGLPAPPRGRDTKPRKRRGALLLPALRCTSCEVRYAQEDGLCRRCQRAKGLREAGVPVKARCKSCCYRYAQEHGLCRSCQRRIEEHVPTTFERETKRCDRRARELEAFLEERRPVILPARLVERTIDGVTFDVHDLTVRTLEPGEFERALAEARGIPQR